MAQPTNLYDTFDTTGIREDLTDVIYNISPEDTPILSAIPRTAAKGTKHEWQLDALAAPAANSVIEGDDATIDAMVATTRAFNFTQIQDKVIALSGTQSSVDAAGRADEMAYQIAKKSKELKKDMEFALIKGTVQEAGDATDARDLGSLPTWIKTNGDAGTNGSLSTGSGTDLPNSGTDRDLTETILKTVIQEVYTSGGDLDLLVVPPSVKLVLLKLSFAVAPSLWSIQCLHKPCCRLVVVLLPSPVTAIDPAVVTPVNVLIFSVDAIMLNLRDMHLL